MLTFLNIYIYIIKTNGIYILTKYYPRTHYRLYNTASQSLFNTSLAKGSTLDAHIVCVQA